MPGNHTDNTPVLSQFGLGQIPFWLKQRSLVTAPGRSLRPGGLMLTRRAADFCGFSADSRILDAGCGYGMTLAYLDEALGISGTGCDPAPEVMAGAVKRQHHPTEYQSSSSMQTQSSWPRRVWLGLSSNPKIV